MKIFKAFVIIIHFNICCTSMLNAQDWVVYRDTNSGLPSNSVSKIKIDAFENKWMVAGNDFVKYDGVNWTIFTNQGGNFIAIDRNDNKWLIRGSNLIKFDNTLWTIYNNSNSCLPNTQIRDGDVDSLNNIWLSTDSGIVKFDNTMTCSTYTISGTNSLQGAPEVKVDSRNWVWTLSNPFTGVEDLSSFDGSTWNNFSSVSISPTLAPSHIFCDSSGNVWGSSGNGIFKCDGSNITVLYDTSISSNFNGTSCVYATSNFIASHGVPLQSFNYFYNSNWNYYNHLNSPYNSYIYDITSDNCGNVWFASDNGLFEFNPSSISNCILSVNEIDNPITAHSYPNPASTEFFVEINQKINHFVIVYITDELGKTVENNYILQDQGINNSTIKIDTRFLVNGIYFYTLFTDKIFHGKIIISNH